MFKLLLIFIFLYSCSKEAPPEISNKKNTEQELKSADTLVKTPDVTEDLTKLVHQEDGSFIDLDKRTKIKYQGEFRTERPLDTKIILSHSNIYFGSLVGKQLVGYKITVKNIGVDKAENIKLSIDNHFSLSQNTCSGKTLHTDEFCTTRVLFSSDQKTLGDYSGDFVATDSLDNSVKTSLFAQIVNKSQANYISVFGDEIVFTPKNNKKIIKNLRIINYGKGVVEGIGYKLDSGEFELLSDGCAGATLGPNQYCSYSIGYHSKKEEENDATASIEIMSKTHPESGIKVRLVVHHDLKKNPIISSKNEEVINQDKSTKKELNDSDTNHLADSHSLSSPVLGYNQELPDDLNGDVLKNPNLKYDKNDLQVKMPPPDMSNFNMTLSSEQEQFLNKKSKELAKQLELDALALEKEEKIKQSIENQIANSKTSNLNDELERRRNELEENKIKEKSLLAEQKKKEDEKLEKEKAEKLAIAHDLKVKKEQEIADKLSHENELKFKKEKEISDKIANDNELKIKQAQEMALKEEKELYEKQQLELAETEKRENLENKALALLSNQQIVRNNSQISPKNNYHVIDNYVAKIEDEKAELQNNQKNGTQTEASVPAIVEIEPIATGVSGEEEITTISEPTEQGIRASSQVPIEISWFAGVLPYNIYQRININKKELLAVETNPLQLEEGKIVNQKQIIQMATGDIHQAYFDSTDLEQEVHLNIQTDTNSCKFTGVLSYIECFVGNVSFYMKDFMNMEETIKISDANGKSEIGFKKYVISQVSQYVIPSSSNQPNQAIYRGELYFQAKLIENQNKLFKINGNNIYQVSNINDGQDDNPWKMVVHSGELYFSALDYKGHSKLYKSDGNNITQLSDIFPNGNDYLIPAIVYNGELYLEGINELGFLKLFKTDGKVITQISDTNANGSDSPSDFVVYQNELYFRSHNMMGHSKLFKLNEKGIKQISDVNSDTHDAPEFMTVYNDELYFATYINNIGSKLFKTDGKLISQVIDINPKENDEPSDLFVFKKDLYFVASDNQGQRKLFKTNGTGYSQVSNLRQGSDFAVEYRTKKSFLTEYNNELYFVAKNKNNAFKIFKTDGEKISQVSNLNTPDQNLNPTGSDFPFNLIVYNQDLYFSAYGNKTGLKLFKLKSFIFEAKEGSK